MPKKKQNESGPEPQELADEIMTDRHFITFSDNDDIYVYDDGSYRKGGEVEIAKLIEKAMADATVHFVNEVIAHVRRRTYIKREDVDLDWFLIGTNNGIVDLRSGEFVEHSPDKIILNKLPVEYDPTARCPEFLEFLKSAQPNPDDRVKLLDHFAACLDRRARKRRALLSIGEKDTGKSTFFGVVEALLGQENVSNVTLQQICGDDRFATAQLYGMMANVYADLGNIPLKYLGLFKAITGGDRISAQQKHKPLFSFNPYVKLLFSCNTPPDVKDVSDEAFFSRWDLIYWRHQVRGSDKDPELRDRMTTPSELSGMLNVLIGVAQRQVRNGHMTFEPSAVEVREFWVNGAEPAVIFLKGNTAPKLEGFTRRADLYKAYKLWCAEHDATTVSEQRFNILVAEFLKATKTSKRIRGKAEKIWAGVELTGKYAADAAQGILQDEMVVVRPDQPSSIRLRRKQEPGAEEKAMDSFRWLFGDERIRRTWYGDGK